MSSGAETVYDDSDVKVTWYPGGHTFNVWYDGQNVDCFTNYNVKNIKDAKRIAKNWLREWSRQ